MKQAKKIEIKVEFTKGNTIQLGQVSECLDEEENLNDRHTSITPEIVKKS